MKKLIEKQLWAFGFLPLLLVIEILEDEEQYELCGLIHDILEEHSKKFEFKIPDKYCPDAVLQMKQNFIDMFGLSGDIAYQNNASYANDILNKIELQVETDKQTEFDRIMREEGEL